MVRYFCDRCNIEITKSNYENYQTLPVLSYDNNGNHFISSYYHLCYDCLTKYVDFIDGRATKELDRFKYGLK